MNTTVRQPVTVETAMTQTKQSQAPKEQNSEDGKFMNMLADAMNNKPAEPVKAPEPAKAESTETESNKPLTEETTETEAPVADQDDGTVYDDQTTAVAVAMQMQGMLPVIAEAPAPEIADGIIAAAQLTGTQSGQTVGDGMAAQAEAAEADGFQADAAKDITANELKPETVAAEKPKTTEAASEEETLAAREKPETTAPRTEEDKTVNGQETQTVRPQTERQEPVRQRPEVSREQSKDAAETTDAGSETEVVRQHRPNVQMHQMRNPAESEEAQAKFDGMLERASRELNQNVAVQKVQVETEVTDEAPIETAEETKAAVQPVQTEIKPQETAKQTEIKAETPKTETQKTDAKLPEEAKPSEHVTVQKNVKAPVTDQRPQKEISKEDEALLGMAQQKQPEIKHEVIRSEPAPPPQQPQSERPDQAEQIKAQVLRNMENKRTEFQMQLQPEELGKVNVKMILENGKLSVEIAAVNPKSAELLSRQAESLAISLKASGADVTSINVVTANENASSEMNGEYNLNNFQNRFQNRENGQSQNGRRNATGGTDEADGSVNQTERESSKAPQRILNYTV